VGACSHVLSCQELNITASRGPDSSDAYPVLKAPGRGCWGTERVSSWGIRIYIRQTGDEILPGRGYCNGREDYYRLFLGLVLFTLVAPPLQLGVVRPYLVWGAWFPSRLPLEGTSRIPIFMP
jgi:hypothetical protein